MIYSLEVECKAENLISESNVLCAHAFADCVLAAALTSEFPSLTNAPHLLCAMKLQPSFQQGEPSNKVTTILGHLRFADINSPDIDKDNANQGWGHDQFTAGGISPSSSLTTWRDVGSVATAFELVAAAIKTCRDARLMCANTGTAATGSFISDTYLEQMLELLEKCWISAGGVSVQFLLGVS